MARRMSIGDIFKLIFPLVIHSMSVPHNTIDCLTLKHQTLVLIITNFEVQY